MAKNRVIFICYYWNENDSTRLEGVRALVMHQQINRTREIFDRLGDLMVVLVISGHSLASKLILDVFEPTVDVHC